MQILYPTIPFSDMNINENLETRCCYTFYRFLKFYHSVNECERIRHAIVETAHEIGISTGYAAKMLVEAGLQAPRHCFPNDFVHFIEAKSGLNPWTAGAMSYAQNKLAKKWHLPV